MSDAVQGVRLRSQRLAHWLDPESAAVVTVLLGLFQLLLSASFAYSVQSPPKLYVLSLILGVVIVAAGSLTIANERTPNPLLLRGCACSNVLGLMVALLAFCLYSYSLSTLYGEQYQCPPSSEHDAFSDYYSFRCPPEFVRANSWSLTMLLLLCDTGAVLTHALLAACAITTLKTE